MELSPLVLFDSVFALGTDSFLSLLTESLWVMFLVVATYGSEDVSGWNLVVWVLTAIEAFNQLTRMRRMATADRFKTGNLTLGHCFYPLFDAFCSSFVVKK